MRIARALFSLLLLAATFKASAQDVTPVIHVANPPTSLVQQAKHYVVLVSLDGFRYDYARVHGAPHLDAMAADGASTPEGMLPSYPSTTFPNHYTLVTGLRPEHHGIVAMEFYDPARKESYKYNDPKASSDGTWYGGTPLWVLAEQQGMRSACFFWPGSDAAIQGMRPTFYLRFDDHVADESRIDQVIAWLKLSPEQRPHFITLYYANTDHAGHDFGPDSPETHEAVHHVDALIGELRDKLKATQLPVDLIVTADHGMIKLDPNLIILDTEADLKNVRHQGALLYPGSPAEAEKILEQLRQHADPRFTVYRREDVPKGLHYDENPREGDPVVVPNGPYLVYVDPPTHKPNVGSHGFDPHKIPQMKAIFYAEGPDIKPGVKLFSFDNIDVFPFIAKLLGLNAPAVDGELTPLAPALRKDP